METLSIFLPKYIERGLEVQSEHLLEMTENGVQTAGKLTKSTKAKAVVMRPEPACISTRIRNRVYE